jgi:hypothetical protein
VDDGQSPEKLDNLGLIRFSSSEELMELLDTDWSEPSPRPGLQQDFTDFKK